MQLLLRTRPGDRTEAQIDTLLAILDNTNKFTKSVDPSLQRSMCRHAQYLRKGSNEVIFRQGDSGDAFYIILSGTVSLHIGRAGGPAAEEAGVAMGTGDFNNTRVLLLKRLSVLRFCCVVHNVWKYPTLPSCVQTPGYNLHSS